MGDLLFRHHRRPLSSGPVLLLLALFLGGAGLAGAVPLQVEVRLPAGPAQGGAPQARILLAPAGGGATSFEARAALPGAATFDVPAGSTWEVTVEAPGYWSQPIPAAASAGSSFKVVDLLPVGRIAGQVRTPPDQKAPGELTVRFRSAPGVPQAFPEVTQTCPVTDGRFSCDVPAGELDLRLRARGFLTHNFWGAKVPAGGTFQAGTLALRPGASVVGWIPAPDRELRYRDCSVSLEPFQLGTPPSLSDAERSPALGQTETVNSRGYFELTGIAPGSYRLVVRHPRYAPARIEPLDVHPGAETEVHSVVLEPAVELEVRLDPPRGPKGERWRVTLLRPSAHPNHLTTVHEGPASEDGVLRVPDMAPGPYEVEVSGGQGTRWALESIEVRPGQAPHVLRLPLVEVAGEVLLGDEPLRAQIWFGGVFGAVRVPAESDEEGRFTTVLPEQDEPWRVEVVHPESQVHATLTEVPVRKAPGQTVARVRLEVPDTAMRGEVVDEEGEPVVGARLRALGPGTSPRAASGEKGKFELRGLSPGEWTLEASADGRQSEPAVVRFEEGHPAEGLRLVLRPQLEMSGQVVGPAGQAIPGALVYASLDQEDRLLAGMMPRSTTDVSGVFRLRLPAGTAGVRLLVLAPGFALRQLRADARAREPLVVPVHQGGGTVVVTFEGGAGLPEPLKQLQTSLFHELWIAPVVLQQWAQAQGAGQEPGRYVVPMLEPGPYLACYGVHELVYRSGRLPDELAARCARGELPPHGLLELKLTIPAGG
jgi:Carboxypeptidase regulatory-like domain